MNNTIKLAVASALLAAASSASAAGGIVAGDWTLDIGGVVNAYVTSTKAKTYNSAGARTADATVSNITTGLLPNYLSVSGKTRQNDLDVAFTISIQPGASTTHAGIQGANALDGAVARAPGNQENRQAFLTFGDASWGSIKLGKDLGIFASDAILNDMTLLGVGNGAGGLAGNTTTTGRIGNGYIYADWKAQAAYTSPNFNGFSFTAGVTQAWNMQGADQVTTTGAGTSSTRGGKNPAFEGKASYAFAADAVTGKVWASGISQKVQDIVTSAGALGSAGTGTTDFTASAWDIGGNVTAAGFGLTAYYFEGKGMGSRLQLSGGAAANGTKLDSDGYYVQGTYALPGVGTKLGVSYGESNMDGVTAATNSSSEMWTVGAYHPLTKHLNLVAEYSAEKGELAKATTSKNDTMSLGAILFF
jgi:predicted porin